jgi:hypothetical protein
MQEIIMTSTEARQNIKNTLNIRLERETDKAKKEEIRMLIKHL